MSEDQVLGERRLWATWLRNTWRALMDGSSLRTNRSDLTVERTSKVRVVHVRDGVANQRDGGAPGRSDDIYSVAIDLRR